MDIKSKPLSLNLSNSQPLGTAVTVLGYPNISLQGMDLKATFGFINANSGLKDDKKFLQFSAPIQPGNSGSPLIDEYGIVVGIVTATINQDVAIQSSGTLAQNVNFAVKMQPAYTKFKNDLVGVKESDSKTVLSNKQIVENSSESVALLMVGFEPGTSPKHLPTLKKSFSRSKSQKSSAPKNLEKEYMNESKEVYEGEIYLYIEPEK